MQQPQQSTLSCLETHAMMCGISTSANFSYSSDYKIERFFKELLDALWVRLTLCINWQPIVVYAPRRTLLMYEASENMPSFI